MDKSILILGDSYCYHRSTQSDWPYILSNLLGYNLLGRGFPGASWWSTRQELLHQLNNGVPSVIIFCHTEPNRIPSSRNLPLNIQTVYKKNIESAISYYENLFVEDFHKWACKMWFVELDEILLKNVNSKIIHIPCYKNDCHIFKEGVSCFKSKSLFDFKAGDLHDYRNHLTDKHNENLAKFLFDIIKNYAIIEKNIDLVI